MYLVHDYMTGMCVQNLLIALITFISDMHENSSMFLNKSWRMNLMKQANGFEKRGDLTYLKSDFKYMTEEGLG